jgi:hypothetical protein
MKKKHSKISIQDLIDQLEQLQNEFSLKHADIELSSFDHFKEVRRQIDIHRETLKAKIDEIALKMIDQTNEREKEYKLKISNLVKERAKIDIDQSNEALINEFRKPNLVINEVKQLMVEHESTIKDFQSKILNMGNLIDEIKSVKFEANKNFKDESFGVLKLNKAKKLINGLW